MTSLSECRRTRSARGRTRGVILLEVLVAFALMTLVAIAGLQVLSQGAVGEARRIDRLRLSEFARSKAEEYVTAYPATPASGEEPGGWVWAIEEAQVRPDGPNRFDADITLYQLSLTVWNSADVETTYEVTTLMARRP